MNVSARQPKWSACGFALVLSLVLVAMLATTSVGLGLLVSSEAVRSAALSRDLDHELAVDSLVVLLADLLAVEGAALPSRPDGGTRVEMDVGRVHVVCDVPPERGKQTLMNRSDDAGTRAVLLELARSNDLPAGSVFLRPLADLEETRGWPRYIWFDQLVTPRGFEESFRWRPLDDKVQGPSERKVWSDVVTFWKVGARSLHVTTSFHADVRLWYLVVEVSNDGVRTLYRGAI